MNIALWILQAILALFFLPHSRLLLDPEKNVPESMREEMQFFFDLSPGFRRFLGVAEILGPLGLILPGLTGILPWLTPLAAAGLALLMAGSIVFHIRRGEASPRLAMNVVVVLLASFVAYGRWLISPH